MGAGQRARFLSAGYYHQTRRRCTDAGAPSGDRWISLQTAP